MSRSTASSIASSSESKPVAFVCVSADLSSWISWPSFDSSPAVQIMLLQNNYVQHSTLSNYWTRPPFWKQYVSICFYRAYEVVLAIKHYTIHCLLHKGLAKILLTLASNTEYTEEYYCRCKLTKVFHIHIFNKNDLFMVDFSRKIEVLFHFCH